MNGPQQIALGLVLLAAGLLISIKFNVSALDLVWQACIAMILLGVFGVFLAGFGWVVGHIACLLLPGVSCG